MTRDTNNDDGRIDRRTFIAGASAASVVGLAGCTDLLTNSEEESSDIGQIGSGRAGRDAPGGTPIADLPDLSGELTLYSGRNQFLVGDLITFVEEQYDDFEVTPRYGGATDLVNQIINEGDGTPADVFFSVNSGALGALADEGRTQSLSDDVLDMVGEDLHTDSWVGTSGRARSIPYNTDVYDESDLPSDIMAYEDFDGDMGWAPGYGSCQAFVTAMRILEGDDRTRQWLEGVVGSGIQSYPDEFAACQAIADGEIDLAFTNHYYIQRVLDGNPEASIATTFTEGDAGAAFNVAGAAVVDATDDADQSEAFVRHLLSAEAQEYFAVETFEYPTIDEVEPVGDLPTVDELSLPDIDLAELSNLEPTIDLMRDVGIEL